MQNQIESQYTRISSSYHQTMNYDSSTVVIPRRSPLLPSIYEIYSGKAFPSYFSLEDLIYGDGRNDPEIEQNNVSTPASEDNEKLEGRIDLKANPTPIRSNEHKIPLINTNENHKNDIQFINCYQYSYNPNEMQLFQNTNADPRYVVQYQYPFNSIATNANDDMCFSEKRNYPEVSLTPGIQNAKMNSYNINDPSKIILDPVELKFIPAEQWTKGNISLENLKKDFFCARSSKCLRFEYKLWNALQITKKYPYLFKEIGVRWVAKSYIMVHRDIFGHLLQVTRPSAALFSSCGMFMTHGFREIMLSEVRSKIDPIDIAYIDESIVRLFAHKENDFNEDSGASDIIKIKWNNESRKKVEKW